MHLQSVLTDRVRWPSATLSVAPLYRMCGRVLHLCVALPCHIAKVCENFVNFERIFLYEPCYCRKIDSCVLWPPATCSFQSGFCLWTNLHDGSDKFDWLRLRGSTGSQYTGPSVDHTQKNSAGYYAYIESSRPRSQGDNARLASQVGPV